jgi:hypothetical protein
MKVSFCKEAPMSALMCSFERVKIQDYEYLLFVVFWNELETPLTKQLRDQAISLGAAIEERGFVVVAFEKASYETAEQVTAKPWPAEVKQRFGVEQDPFMLIINKDFQEFDPRQHPWTIVWFSEHRDHPDQVYKVLSRIVRIVRSGSSLFEHFKANEKKSWYQKWAKFVEIKPEVYGISVDAKGILEEALGLQSS